MRCISTEGFERPERVISDAAPMLQWISIDELVIDPTYQRPIAGQGRKNVDRIARAFSWSCFAPVVVSPVAGGRFAIIDGQHRTTAAALVGFDTVPCQVVIAAQHEQAAAFKAINGVTTPISAMALHAAAVIAQEPWALEISDACARSDVELLRYPVPLALQQPGQTMAIGALSKCLKDYGRDTLITCLQCVTQTENNKPGMLSSRIIKAICQVLSENRAWRDGGLALLEIFDDIDLEAIQSASFADSQRERSSRVGLVAERIRQEIEARWTLRKQLAAE